MTKLITGSIVSFIYNDKLRIASVEKVRDLSKKPLKETTDNAYHAISKRLYTCIEYDGEVKQFYEGGMKDVSILSTPHFVNGDLRKRFDAFKNAVKEKYANMESGVTGEEDIHRLHLKGINEGAKIRFKFYTGKHKTVRYAGYENKNGKAFILTKIPGINVISRTPANKIKYIITSVCGINPIQEKPAAYTTVKDDKGNVENKPRFTIPDWEVAQGFSDLIWNPLSQFAIVNNRYRFFYRDGGWPLDGKLLSIQRTHNDIIVEIKIDGKGIIVDGIIADTLKIFNEIILLEKCDDNKE